MALITQFPERHFSTHAIIQYLDPNPNLPDTQYAIAKIFSDCAVKMLEMLEDSPELTVGLRKLLEAKDCFIRASLDLGGS